MAETRCSSSFRSRLVVGLALAAAGALLALDNLGVVDLDPVWFWWTWWPAALIAVGLFQLASPRRHWAGGLLLIGLGSWFLLRDLTPLGLLPVALLMIGIGLVAESLGRGRDGAGTPPATPDLRA